MITLKNLSELVAGDKMYIYEFIGTEVKVREVEVISSNFVCSGVVLTWRDGVGSQERSHIFPPYQRFGIWVGELYSTDPELQPWLEYVVRRGVNANQETLRDALGIINCSGCDTSWQG